MEMISLKSPREIELMRRAGRLTAQARALAGSMVRPGVSTLEIDSAVRKFIVRHGARPSFLGYGGFPGSACISVNDVVIHGIPDHRKLEEGDIVSVDVGSIYKGYNGDAARTFMIGRVSEEKRRLVEVTKQSFFEGIKVLKDGCRLGDLGHAIQSYVESNGFSVVRALVGHGIGTDMHEDPSVPNYGTAGRGMRLKAGMTIAIEPMVNMGTYEVKVLKDDWTVVTLDGAPSAHYENTVVITQDGCEILSL